MDFWERLKTYIKARNTTQEWVSQKSSIPFGTFRKWLSRKTMPNADQALQIAKALDTTIEELVAGDEGRDYIISWAERNSGKWKAPDRIADIVNDLMILDEEQLESVRLLARAQADKTRSKADVNAG